MEFQAIVFELRKHYTKSVLSVGEVFPLLTGQTECLHR